MTAEELLESARAGLDRLSPQQAQAATTANGLLIDIRAESQRERDGLIPGALFIARNVLEWRCDPGSPWREAAVFDPPGRRLIVFCNEGYQSSLVAATLQQLGHEDATDVIGGFQAWREAGLDVTGGAQARPRRSGPPARPAPPSRP